MYLRFRFHAFFLRSSIIDHLFYRLKLPLLHGTGVYAVFLRETEDGTEGLIFKNYNSGRSVCVLRLKDYN